MWLTKSLPTSAAELSDISSQKTTKVMAFPEERTSAIEATNRKRLLQKKGLLRRVRWLRYPGEKRLTDRQTIARRARNIAERESARKNSGAIPKETGAPAVHS